MRNYKLSIQEPFKGGKYGKLYHKNITYSNKEDFKLVCPECGRELFICNGKYGEFYNCPNHRCTYTYTKDTLDWVIRNMEKEINSNRQLDDYSEFSVYICKFDGARRLEATVIR